MTNSLFKEAESNRDKSTGMPAFLLFTLVVVYCVMFNRFFNGTIWKHIRALGDNRQKISRDNDGLAEFTNQMLLSD